MNQELIKISITYNDKEYNRVQNAVNLISANEKSFQKVFNRIRDLNFSIDIDNLIPIMEVNMDSKEIKYNPDIPLNNEEFAAALLHEIGHIFNQYVQSPLIQYLNTESGISFSDGYLKNKEINKNNVLYPELFADYFVKKLGFGEWQLSGMDKMKDKVTFIYIEERIKALSSINQDIYESDSFKKLLQN